MATSVDGLPPELADRLDGRGLDGQDLVALPLITVDADLWPRAALLSVGEILAVGRRRLYLAVWRDTTTHANLVRTGKALLMAVEGSGSAHVQLAALPLDPSLPKQRSIACFTADVVHVRHDAVDYAHVIDGIRFDLVDPNATFESWRATHRSLRSVAGLDPSHSAALTDAPGHG